MNKEDSVSRPAITIGPAFYVGLIFLTGTLVFPGIYDLFFEPNKTSAYLFVVSIPAILVFSLLSLLIHPRFLQWQKRGKAWLFLLGNVLVVWVAALCFTYFGLILG